MKSFHPLSFIYGLASGLVVLLLFVGVMRLVNPSRGYARGGGFNVSNPQMITRMAQRFGMSETDLQAELKSGKTLQQIAQEHGVQFGGGRNGGNGGGNYNGGNGSFGENASAGTTASTNGTNSSATSSLASSAR
jgi:hypothetical protein